jgi:hypothetical protein
VAKNEFMLTQIWHLGLRVWRRRLKSEAAKYFEEMRDAGGQGEFFADFNIFSY